MKKQEAFRSILALMAVIILFTFSNCGSDDTTTSSSTCSSISGTSAWSPSVTGVSADNRSDSVSVTSSTQTVTGQLIGLGQSFDSSQLVTATFTVGDVGDNGSITLVADVINLPATVSGTTFPGDAYPILVSLHDGSNELVNAGIAGSSDDCAAAGFFSCNTSTGVCGTNNNCTVSSPSAFNQRDDWIEHQVPPFGTVSTNVFPTCNWSSGSPSCAFNSNFFDGTTLRAGTYTAKYALVAEQLASISETLTADLSLNVIQKVDANTYTSGLTNGSIELNVVFVGTSTIEASRTTKGQTNLNALYQIVYDHYNQTKTGIKISAINTFEWTCEQGGDTYATLDLTDASAMFSTGSALMSADSSTRAVNLFMVGDIQSSLINGTIHGVAGAIGGAPVHGQGTSGVAINTFGKLATFNASCTDTSCPSTSQDAEFVDFGGTIIHEMGHYLGLNHPSESDASRHDPIADTPECSTASSGFVTADSCLSSCSGSCSGYNGTDTFCPTTEDCQFNHVMWWTTKNYAPASGTGDGNLFSTDSSRILNYSPLVQ